MLIAEGSKDNFQENEMIISNSPLAFKGKITIL